jgi:dienelactone hydrolase
MDVKVHVTRTISGDGYHIENLSYESREGVSVAANLYLPSPLRKKMPAIVIIHSHHNPKTQGELQDMGMTWARNGCAVLVMDQLGYGDRRHHPPGPRQDYRFRYINGIQLHLIGESLMGCMVYDIMRGIDLLLSRPGIDENKVILIGAVAGGGDPAAVTAAIDTRITCVIPFNFGGPQPETPYPFPNDAEETFNYMGSGSWESTRNLRLSGRDGFLPWVIVASIAPRRLIYSHEFSWDKVRDPVWKRLKQVFAWYDASDNLAFTHGAGILSGRPPQATHCNNVGIAHCVAIHEALQRWFDIPIPQEYQNRLSDEALSCIASETQPRPTRRSFAEIGASRAASTELMTCDKRLRLREEWAKRLGDVEPRNAPEVRSHTSHEHNGIHVEKITLVVETHIVVPLLLLFPAQYNQKRIPVVIALSQAGKEKFISARADELVGLLENGVAVCLPDVRGTGETNPAASREYGSEATSISATELMLGGTLLGARLRDVRSVMRYLQTQTEIDAKQMALWGDSFAPTNPPHFKDPLIGEGESAHQSEPLGGLLALFGALYSDDVRAVAMRGMIASYQSVLRDEFCYVPHDVIIPDALVAGDLGDVVAILAPRALRFEALVDGRNCPMEMSEVKDLFGPALQAYRTSDEKSSFMPTLKQDLAAWFVESLTDSHDSGS